MKWIFNASHTYYLRQQLYFFSFLGKIKIYWISSKQLWKIWILDFAYIWKSQPFKFPWGGHNEAEIFQLEKNHNPSSPLHVDVIKTRHFRQLRKIKHYIPAGAERFPHFFFRADHKTIGHWSSWRPSGNARCGSVLLVFLYTFLWGVKIVNMDSSAPQPSCNQAVMQSPSFYRSPSPGEKRSGPPLFRLRSILFFFSF